MGAELDGQGGSTGPAGEVVDLIRNGGGEAIANGDDVADWAGAERLVGAAVDAYGRLDVVVNNAGIVRDRMVVTMDEDEWDAVMRVHLKGTFATTHFAALHWRERSKAGEQPSGRVINTSSGAGLFGSVGQANYSAAKAGIATFTIVAAAELARYGATVNAIAPSARTRMTETTFAEMMAKPDEGFDRMAPDNVAPLVVWLGSQAASERQRPGVRGRGRRLTWPTAGAAARASTRAPAGSPPRWAPPSPTCSARPNPRPRLRQLVHSTSPPTRLPCGTSCGPFTGIVNDDIRARLGRGEGGPLYRSVVQQIGRDGWLGIGWPKEYGGQGRSAMDQFLFFDEAMRAGAPVPFVTLNTVGPTLIAFGSDEQKARSSRASSPAS